MYCAHLLYYNYRRTDDGPSAVAKYTTMYRNRKRPVPGNERFGTKRLCRPPYVSPRFSPDDVSRRGRRRRVVTFHSAASSRSSLWPSRARPTRNGRRTPFVTAAVRRGRQCLTRKPVPNVFSHGTTLSRVLPRALRPTSCGQRHRNVSSDIRVCTRRVFGTPQPLVPTIFESVGIRFYRTIRHTFPATG